MGINLMKLIFEEFSNWVRRSNERYALSQLSERQLRDIGLDRSLVSNEVMKPFWRA